MVHANDDLARLWLHKAVDRVAEARAHKCIINGEDLTAENVEEAVTALAPEAADAFHAFVGLLDGSAIERISKCMLEEIDKHLKR